ncbi:MAG: acyltransferase [Fibrobacter sp.]|nr:acyltransferase [Fibrobacter sp.]
MFLKYINNFRGVAILIILAYHSLHAASWGANDILKRVLEITVMNCTLMFIFISGYLFQYLLPKYNYKLYLKKKFRNVIVPYLFMSAPAVILLITNSKYVSKPWIYETGLMGESILTDIFFLEITGSQWYHFWFIPMIVIFYLLAPLFNYITKHPKLYYGILLLLMISFFISRPQDNNNPFHSFLYYLPVYLTGMVSCQFSNKINMVVTRYLGYIFFLLLIISAAIYFTSINDLSIFQKIVMSYFFLGLMLRFSEKDILFLNVSAKYSFGLYFIHMYVIFFIMLLIRHFDINILIPDNFISFILLFILVTIVSLMILTIMKKIIGHNSRIIMGS